MATMTDKYAVLYKAYVTLSVLNNTITIPSSDIVSISFTHEYDMKTYPIIRIRLYSDLSIMTSLCEAPDDIFVRCNLDGGVYRLNDDDKSPSLVSSASSMSFGLKVYIENKNIPTSTSDQYENGIKKDTSLNTNVKVPIELFCYDESLVHKMKQKTDSIYKNMSLTTAINDILFRNNITECSIDPLHNQTKYDQILLPNLNVLQSLTFFDRFYGLYDKGCQVYGDTDKLYICNTNTSDPKTTLPIYVSSYKSNVDVSGLKKLNNGKYYMSTLSTSVSLTSESDVERTLNSQYITSINVNTLESETSELTELFEDSNKSSIQTPNELHKSVSKYINTSQIARINEKITKIDVAGEGFDICKMKINSRYNLIFESPIRGMSINKSYRATYTAHVLTNLNSELFIAQTIMNLCSN